MVVAANIYSLREKRWLSAPHYFSMMDVALRWAEWEAITEELEVIMPSVDDFSRGNRERW
jgi:hypothetical protein